MVQANNLGRMCPWCREELTLSKTDINRETTCPACQKRIRIQVEGIFSKSINVRKVGFW
jgi:hypothetical protein